MAGPYSAGTVFLEVVPSFRNWHNKAAAEAKARGQEARKAFDEGFDDEQGKRSGRSPVDKLLDTASGDAEKAGKESGEKFTGAFQRALQRNMREATASLGKGIDNELDDVRKRLTTIGKLKIGTELDSEDAVKEFRALEAKLNAAAKNMDLSIQARVNADQGARDLAKFRAMVEAAMAKPVDINVDFDSRRAKLLQERVQKALAANGAYKVEIEARDENVRRTLAKITAEIKALKADVTLGIDEEGVTERVAALQARLATLRDETVTIEADADVAAAMASLAALDRQVKRTDGHALDAANSFRSFSGLVLGIATLGPLVVPALGAIAAGIAGVGIAGAGAVAGLGTMILGFSGLGDAIGAMNDVENSAAKDSLTNSRTMRTAAKGIRDAEISVARAREASAEAAEQSARRVKDAQASVVDAEKNLARVQLDARRQVADAERALEDAQDDARRAQEDLNDAREKASEQLEELGRRLRGGLLDERQAVLDLEEAQVRYRNIMADSQSTAREREQATISYEKQKLALEDLRAENAELTKQQQEAARTGVEGSDLVTRAREREQEAQERVTRSQENLARTQTETQERIANAQESVAKAVQGVRDAMEAQQRQARDSSRAIEDAQRRLGDAQAAYQESLERTSDIGSAAMLKLKNAMGELSPAGQEFARFIFGLKQQFLDLRAVAQEGMLPGLQRGLETLFGTYGPLLFDFIGNMSKMLGSLFERMGTALTSPIWRDFFETMAEMAPMFTEQFAMVAGNVATAIAAIMTAMAPFAEDFGKALVDLTAGWVAWSATLQDNPAFQQFLGYLYEVGPEVWQFLVAFGAALLNLAEALAPYASDLLRFFTGFLNFIAGMDPELLGGIVVGIIALATAAQAVFGIISFIMASGAITTAFGALAAVITGAGVAAASTAAVVAGVAAAVVGAAILIGGAFYLLWTRSETFREVVVGAWEAVQAGAEKLWSYLEPFLVSFGELFRSIYEEHIRPAVDGLIAAWPEIYENLRVIWESFLQPLLTTIAIAVGLVIATFLGFALAVVSAVANALGPVIEMVAGVVGGITTILRGLVDFVAGILTGDWSRAWGGIVAIFKGTWDTIWAVLSGAVKVIWALVSGFVQGIVNFFVWLWDVLVGHSIIPDLVNAIFGWFGNLRDWVIGLVQGFVQKIVDFWNWVKNESQRIFKEAVQYVSDKIGELPGIFTNVVGLIKNAWEGLKEVAKAPIRFIVNTVVNDGLIAGFNKLAGVFGADGIERISLPQGFSRGGWTGAGDKYAPAGIVHRDEFVIRKESQQNLSRKFPGLLDYLNAFGTLPGFASGGLVAFGRMLQQRGFRVSEHPAFGGVHPVHTKNSLHYSGNAIDVNWAPGTSAAEQRAIDAIVPLAIQAGLRVIWRVKDHFNHAHFDTGRGGKNLLGKIGDVLGGLFDDPVGYLKEQVVGKLEGFADHPFAKILRGGVDKVLGWAGEKVMDLLGGIGEWLTGKGDSHAGPVRDVVKNAAAGYGWDQGGMWAALDWIIQTESSWNPNAKNPRSTAYGLFQFLDGTWGGVGYRKSDDPAIQAAAGLKYIRERYGNPVAAKIFHQRKGYYAEGGKVEEGGGERAPLTALDGVPAGLYDSGGFLPPGLSMALNLTGANEHKAVFTDQQWAALQGVATGRGGVDVNLRGANFYAYDPTEVAREIRLEQEDALAMLGDSLS